MTGFDMLNLEDWSEKYRDNVYKLVWKLYIWLFTLLNINIQFVPINVDQLCGLSMFINQHTNLCHFCSFKFLYRSKTKTNTGSGSQTQRIEKINK